MNIQKRRDDLEMRTFDIEKREIRAYKRRLRRQRCFIRRCIMALVTLCIILVCTVSYHAIQSSASTADQAVKFKYYTTITVDAGETVWDIADEFIDHEMYKNKNAYIAEVASINKLDADCTIKAGQHLIVPYYSDEFVK